MDEYQTTGNQKYPLAPIVDRWKRVFAAARKDRKKKRLYAHRGYSTRCTKSQRMNPNNQYTSLLELQAPRNTP